MASARRASGGRVLRICSPACGSLAKPCVGSATVGAYGPLQVGCFDAVSDGGNMSDHDPDGNVSCGGGSGEPSLVSVSVWV